ncbi:MAG: hypothetical protein OXH64_04370, partial [Rhodospirillaceae bacterium]|nr:hypothetical protein [Rhodospirillaceae bacterium]
VRAAAVALAVTITLVPANAGKYHTPASYCALNHRLTVLDLAEMGGRLTLAERDLIEAWVALYGHFYRQVEKWAGQGGPAELEKMKAWCVKLCWRGRGWKSCAHPPKWRPSRTL